MELMDVAGAPIIGLVLVIAVIFAATWLSIRG
jgi:flagellin-like protein